MACTNDKFVINKGMNNEFIITIKQNDNTLPMLITEGDENKVDVSLTTKTPSYNIIPEVEFVAAVATIPEVVAVAGTDFVAEVIGKVENYSVSVGTLSETAVIIDEGLETESITYQSKDYSLYINDVPYTITYTAAAYPSKYHFFVALKDLINAGSTNGITLATVDENSMELTGLTRGEHYTTNSDDIFNVIETQTAVTPVTGVAYTSGVEYAAEIPGTAEVPAVAEMYESVATILVFDITDSQMTQYENYSTDITVTGGTIDSIFVDGVEVTDVAGIYTVGRATNVQVNTTDLGTLVAEPEDIALSLSTTYSSPTPDSFELVLYELETGDEVATLTLTDQPTVGVIEVYDAANGQIIIKMYDALVETLETERGRKSDGYYIKPTYRLAIDCETLNNGNFVAKIDNVYVEA